MNIRTKPGYHGGRNVKRYEKLKFSFVKLLRKLYSVYWSYQLSSCLSLARPYKAAKTSFSNAQCSSYTSFLSSIWFIRTKRSRYVVPVCSPINDCNTLYFCFQLRLAGERCWRWPWWTGKHRWSDNVHNVHVTNMREEPNIPVQPWDSERFLDQASVETTINSVHEMIKTLAPNRRDIRTAFRSRGSNNRVLFCDLHTVQNVPRSDQTHPEVEENTRAIKYTAHSSVRNFANNVFFQINQIKISSRSSLAALVTRSTRFNPIPDKAGTSDQRTKRTSECSSSIGRKLPFCWYLCRWSFKSFC